MSLCLLAVIVLSVVYLYTFYISDLFGLYSELYTYVVDVFDKV